MRADGILLPVSSIPSPYGIGAFSKEAYAFVDFLEKAGQTYWQILPLGPTGYGDSPYQSFSTFAGNPYYIDLEQLTEEGLLKKEDCEKYDFGQNAACVDYEKIYLSRFKILYQAFENSRIEEKAEFLEFALENQHWLNDYALYMAIKDSLSGISWAEWEEEIRTRKAEALESYQRNLKKEILFYKFQQYLFRKQWVKLKKYANDKGILIIGDIPIYVAFDSADTWAHPELFQLDEAHLPMAVAGCPPDAFSATGQLWGNPLYRWDYHKETGYQWWMQRLSHCYELYDVVRIDHFRGFDEYYSIPYGDKTAEHGKWEKGPGYGFFQMMKETLGNKAIIAEDLGYLTPSVKKLVKRTRYPGMKVLQFAFDSNPENEYLPHNHIQNSIVYTGTHDNDTTLGWFQAMKRKDKRFVKNYLGIKASKEIQWEFIRCALASVAETAIVPMQDYLGLGGEARINLPSTLGGNWTWRLVEGELTKELAGRIYEMSRLYGRIPKRKGKAED